ncbi:MAG TPA: type II toxin-antitoxin system VapC family toxin [Ktedonobacterales bacterium]|nr:type II toxin-antitoxin system VapC family toxin [Ktedonobacterales bacterium]
MASYFLDTSALVKRYVDFEPGHAWITAICDPAASNDLLISEAALAETVATFCRMARENPPRVSAPDRDALIALFRQHDTQQSYYVVRVDRAIYVRAGDLCTAHPLRAYDAIQIAGALTARDDALQAGVDPPIFISADAQLLAAAVAEGLPTDNPTNHP